MTATPQRAAALLLLLSVFSASGDVIFSRRVYKEHGTSYQQLWAWNPASGNLKAVTNTARDHFNPICVGRTIRFTSPSPDITDHVKLWALNPSTGQETQIGPAPEPTGRAFSQKAGCDRYAKAGELEACGNEETLTVSRSGKQVGRFQIQVNTCQIDSRGTLGKCETPIFTLKWSDDARWLLIGEQGVNDGSGQRQEDYYVLNLADMRLNPMASAYLAFWLPNRDEVLYVTPQDLADLPSTGPRKHSVWVQQLMSFDPARNKSTAITSGLTNNVDPSWCDLISVH